MAAFRAEARELQDELGISYYSKNLRSFWRMIGEMSEVHRSQLEGTFPCWISDNVGFKINYNILQFSSVAQSCLTFCDHMDCSMPGLPVHRQFPENYPNSCPLSWWCHLTISSSLIPFSSHLQSFPASRFFFPVSQLFPKRKRWPKYWSFSFSISPSNE